MSTVKTPRTLNDVSVKILTDRLRDEYTAHYFYRNATNWCAGIGYLKAAAFFAAESVSELEHAMDIQKFLVDWNVDPLLPSIKPNIQFTDLIDIVNKSYAMENGLFESYCKNSTELFATDINTFDFLTKYRGIQNDAVIEYSDLLNAAMLVDTNNKFDILYFEQTYFN
jgi:ferritin